MVTGELPDELELLDELEELEELELEVELDELELVELEKLELPELLLDELELPLEELELAPPAPPQLINAQQSKVVMLRLSVRGRVFVHFSRIGACSYIIVVIIWLHDG